MKSFNKTHHDLDDILETMKDIWLLKDLCLASDKMIHESYLGNGFCYRRFNKVLKKKEQLAYTGYFGAWTDNPEYFIREMQPNTQLQRNALRLKYVFWLGIGTTIDKVQLVPSKPFYDIYMYHGCNH